MYKDFSFDFIQIMAKGKGKSVSHRRPERREKSLDLRWDYRSLEDNPTENSSLYFILAEDKDALSNN